jgi:hypothetical protein
LGTDDPQAALSDKAASEGGYADPEAAATVATVAEEDDDADTERREGGSLDFRVKGEPSTLHPHP